MSWPVRDAKPRFHVSLCVLRMIGKLAYTDTDADTDTDTDVDIYTDTDTYTIQYNTIQYNTIQYNTIQYNTILIIMLK